MGDGSKVKEVGCCLRRMSDGSVTERNEASFKVCGDQSFCDGSETCQSLLKDYLECFPIRTGAELHKNIEMSPGRFVDVVLVPEGNTVKTMIVSKSTNEEAEVVQKAFLESHGLTKSEVAIMISVFQGKCNQTIADELFISKATLKTHLNNIYKKLPKGLRPIQNRGKTV